MTDAQIYQLAGIALASLGLVWIINPQVFKATIKNIAENEGSLLLSGFSALIMGYLILVVHHSESIIMQILGWIALIKGWVIIISPVTGLEFKQIIRGLKGYHQILSWLVLAMGASALYLGFLGR
jgi:hypothetical protein